MNLRRAMVWSMACMTLLMVPISPASAGERGVEQGWVVPFPQSDVTNALASYLVSGDLKTAVIDSCQGDSGLTFIDLATATSTNITGSPEGSCDGSDGTEPDPPLYATFLHAVADDGSALITTSWEGLEDGDTDGGLSDVVLVDRNTGGRRLLTGSVPDRSFQGMSLSDNASRAILWSYALDGTDTRFHVWKDGILSDLAVPEPDGVGLSALLSGDGQYLFSHHRTVGELHRLNLDTGTSIHTPFTATCCGLVQLAVSYDGSVAAWVGPPSGANEIFTPLLTTWDMTTTKVHQIHTGPVQSAPIHLSDDGKTVLGTSRTFTDDIEPRAFFFWSLDIATSTITPLVDERPNGGPWMRVDAISGDGQQAVVSTMGPIGYEPASPEVIQRGRVASRQYLWDATLTPPPYPGSDPTLASQTERLYQAFFQRTADPAGLNHWINAQLGPADLATVAQEFASSTEFEQTYGNLDDAAFIELLYQNVFNRPVDSDGATYWQGLLAAGTSRGAVVAAISESPEHITRTNTLPPRNQDEAALRRLYAAYFLRDADPDGLTYWLGQHRSGTSLETISEAFATSPEFANNYGSLENYRFILMAYLNVIGRYPDTNGGSYWQQQLDGGLPRGELMIAFSQAPEFINLTTGRIATPALP